MQRKAEKRTTEKRVLVQLSVVTETDWRTVRREIETPFSVRGLPGDRIRRTLRTHPLFKQAYENSVPHTMGGESA